jgi:hypothetical protein
MYSRKRRRLGPGFSTGTHSGTNALASQKPGIALFPIFGDGLCKTLGGLRANRVLGADSSEGAFIEFFRWQHELSRSYQNQFFR